MTDGPDRPFALSHAQERLMAEVRALAKEVLAPLVAAGRPGRVNRELVRALGEHGLLARLLPSDPDRAAGGQGATALELCLLREALARESTEAETALALQGLGAHPIAAAGSAAVRRRFLPDVVAGLAVQVEGATTPPGASPATSCGASGPRSSCC